MKILTLRTRKEIDPLKGACYGTHVSLVHYFMFKPFKQPRNAGDPQTGFRLVTLAETAKEETHD